MKQSIVQSNRRYLIQSHFDDFDAFSEAARLWQLDFLQLDRGGFSGSVFQSGIEGGQISWANFNRKLEQHGQAPEGMMTFVVPASECLRLNWRRHQVEGNDLLIFPVGGELDSMSNESFDVITISLNLHWLERAEEWVGVPGVMQSIRSKEVIRLAPTSCDRLRQACLSYLSQMKAAPQHSIAGAMDGVFMQELPRLLIQVVCESMLGQGSSPAVKMSSGSLKRAHNAIVDQAHKPVTVKELCQISGASERSLQYAFREKFEVSPKAYVQAYRLNQVRKRLRVADPKTSLIADLANAMGFWHMGQFAKDYRSFFGELPSETLKK